MSAGANAGVDCPLCCEPLDATDLRFRPCGCGYQVCAWCWHSVMELAAKDDAKGRCPACRTEYDESTIRFDEPPPPEAPATKQPAPGGKSRRSSRDGNPGASRGAEHGGDFSRAEIIAARRHLHDARVIQRDLAYVVGLTPPYCREEMLLSGCDLFSRFGPIAKVQTSPPKPGDAHQFTGGAYVTYRREEDAERCIRELDGTTWDGKTLRASRGTTKYCNAFLRAARCGNPECAYLHRIANDADVLTREAMFAKYHNRGAAGTNKGKHKSTEKPGEGERGGGENKTSRRTVGLGVSAIPAPRIGRPPGEEKTPAEATRGGTEPAGGAEGDRSGGGNTARKPAANKPTGGSKRTHKGGATFTPPPPRGAAEKASGAVAEPKAPPSKPPSRGEAGAAAGKGLFGLGKGPPPPRLPVHAPPSDAPQKSEVRSRSRFGFVLDDEPGRGGAGEKPLPRPRDATT